MYKDSIIGLSKLNLIDKLHIDYLKQLSMSYTPGVIYDIGACVGEWSRHASSIWPSAKIIAFEAIEDMYFLFDDMHIDYSIGVLSDTDFKTVDFYGKPDRPFGASYYQENKVLSPGAAIDYGDNTKTPRIAMTLDTITQQRQFPMPDLIKIDVQGAEVDVLKGAYKCISNAKHMIVEIQDIEYNVGAGLAKDTIPFIESLGFKLVTRINHMNWNQDYHFINVK